MDNNQNNPDAIRRAKEAEANAWPKTIITDLTDLDGNTSQEIITVHPNWQGLPGELRDKAIHEQKELQRKFDSAALSSPAACVDAMWDFHCLAPEDNKVWIVSVQEYEEGELVGEYLAHVASSAEKAFTWCWNNLQADSQSRLIDAAMANECFHIVGEAVDGRIMDAIPHFGYIRANGRFTNQPPTSEFDSHLGL